MKKVISPIGVPRVPFQQSPESDVQWIDIYSRLYIERILFIFFVLDENIVNQLIASLFYLNYADNRKEMNEISLYINSIGGSLLGGITLYDVMQYIKIDIMTTCMGVASSVSALILANGKYPKRKILPHSRVLLHQPTLESYGQASDVIIESEGLLRFRQLLGKIYIEHTTQTLSRIARDMDRDCFLSSREALNYGLVDQILIG